MELNPLIARVAVLRSEARAARQKLRAAGEASQEADDKLRKAEDGLHKEIRDQVDALDPETDSRT